MPFRDNKKPKFEDKEFTADVSNEDFTRHDMVRVFAVGKVFTKISFKQANFLGCYFRNCRFIECDFTGAFVKETNLRGSQFENCTFRYTAWEKSHLDDDFLDRCLPSEENLARDLVRSLRVNFAEIGNYEAVNRAASIEVHLTGQHLYKAAYSKESYYRSKYKGGERLSHAAQHARWKVLDLLWGNGESIVRILISCSLAILAVSALYSREAKLSLADALMESIWQFWGKQYAQAMPPIYALALTITQFVAFGLFMAILVKRLSRR
ncbi:hypothetical protein HNP55_004402 [Paucibacter oligotrophus]|uniref:Pentapeptide repeat protein n=1 Tax=Roseateles oligotrophus TaxID=1769250 RepID=A0A840LCG2_9BURK|nr:pentapeptide repeat-containing protein [Roseateles oligotrophus]MBB4845850.1 hypothetical protein [Roseateles oligotrophus]